MFLVWLLTGILASLHVVDAMLLWHWFGHHLVLTILMIFFLG